MVRRYSSTCAACQAGTDWASASPKAPAIISAARGDRQLNNGAGMTRVLTRCFRGFTTCRTAPRSTPVLSDADAYDVRLHEQPRASDQTNLDKDFPNKQQKPVDTPYGPTRTISRPSIQIWPVRSDPRKVRSSRQRASRLRGAKHSLRKFNALRAVDAAKLWLALKTI